MPLKSQKQGIGFAELRPGSGGDRPCYNITFHRLRLLAAEPGLIHGPTVAFVVESRTGPFERQPTKLVLSFYVEVVSKFSPEEHGQHPIVPVFVGGVEKLGGFSDSTDQMNAASEFFPDFANERLLGRFPRQTAAARKPKPAHRAAHHRDRFIFSKDHCVGRTALDIRRTFTRTTKGRAQQGRGRLHDLLLMDCSSGTSRARCRSV